MNVVISGGGIAGLACASYLRRLPSIASVILLEASRETFPAQKKFTGLWTPALHILEDLLPAGSSKRLLKNATYVEGSGIRDYNTVRDGQWLMRPAVHMQAYLPGSGSKLPALGFFENGALLTALREQLSERGRVPVTIRYNTEVIGVNRISNSSSSSSSSQGSRASIHTSTGESMECDLLVAADGADSRLYRILHPQKQAETRLKYRGYDVYRGTTRQPKEKVGDSFQMWGPGTRFAMVSLSSNRVSSIREKPNHSRRKMGGIVDTKSADVTDAHTDGDYAWFAAVSGTGVEASSNNTDNTVPFAGPFSNGAKTAGSAALAELRGNMHDWQVPPVQSVLELSKHIDYSDVTVTQARASTSVESLSKMYKTKDGGIEGESTTTIPVVFCGDAFHTFDPILAVGAGMALEQARTLFSSLEKVPAAGGMDAVASALKLYDTKIRMRAQKLSVLSDIAQRFGHVKSPIMSIYRNTLMSQLPDSAKGRVMLMMMNIVADCEPVQK